ncbi:helix-turn-helix domain-containing protein [Streptomyces sp. NPDC012950]|uniref:helix-turn-helix domain-containing protein n=1 Tax=Streptomyces sp. NPDC012950 TaxID=3364858 RepID=UPI0036B5622C
MTDAPPTRAQRFAAVVRPAAQSAGYTGHGSKSRLARDTGMTESSVSRMLLGQSIPDPTFFEAIAKAINLPVRDLLVEAGIISGRALTETSQSQVRSRITPETAADELGITDPVNREMFFAAIERLRRQQNTTAPEESGREHGAGGGVAAEQ